MSNSSELLVEERRGGLVECEYAGHICGVMAAVRSLARTGLYSSSSGYSESSQGQ
ncbi:hypothetical protein [Paenibacillus puerhi]|uniref:hypothetical protein n=1 Tax=Paenibacillus puerhi TaxID=2692622 RepID=UPI001357EED2|nr:hypothetical protein [Paenibacillus puerhi]